MFQTGIRQIVQDWVCPAHPNSLALMPDGNTLYVTVKAPHGNQHPAWRADGLGNAVRMDLPEH